MNLKRDIKQGKLPSLLIVSHTYAIEPHALKLEALKAHFEVTCVTVSRADSGLPPLPKTELQKRLVGLRLELPVWGRVPTRYGFRGLNTVIRSRVWDFMMVEAEPWQPLKWQALMLAKLAGRECVRCYGEFTWENVLRPGMKGWVLSWVYQFSASVLDFWVAGNDAAGSILRGYGMPPERVLVCTQVGVGLPMAEAGSEERKNLKALAELTEGALVAGFAGRLVPEKGIEDLYQAVREVNADGGRPVELVLMGRGPLESSMRRRQESGEAPWLHLVPPVTFEEVEKHLPVMDVLVLGSHSVRTRKMCWEEQFGHILVEAMAVGVVVCGARSGAIPEVIGDEEMLFESGDVEGLATLLRRCADDVVFFQARRQAQRQRVREVFSHKAVAARHAKFLTGIQPRS
jgi:glycosyltransferase involved in cell wall biosynthesis